MPICVCPYHNVLPEIVYCCFARTMMFTKNLTRCYNGRYGVLLVSKVSFINSVRFLS